MKRVFLWALLTLAAPLLPVIILLGSVNPFVLAFQWKTHITNRTGKRLWVTLIGRYAGARREPVPLYAWALPAIPSLRVGMFPLAPAGSRRFVFDRDHIEEFIEVVVQDEQGEYRHLTVPRFQEHCVLDDWQALPLAPPEVMAAIPKTQRVRAIVWALTFVGIVVDVGIGLLMFG